MLMLLGLVVWGLALVLARITPHLRVGVILLSLPVLGFAAAGLRSHWVAAPVLDQRMYTTITGQVIHKDQSFSGRPRVIVKTHTLGRLPQLRTPHFVRVALHNKWQAETPDIGHIISITAHLAPPPGPVEPHAFDFQRAAWFQRLGAVGYAHAPFVIWDQPPISSPRTWVGVARFRVADMFERRLSPDAWGVAAAITVGLRGNIAPDRLSDLRRANLAHLLAISGLHMGMIMTLAFVFIRALGALWPQVSLRFEVKKIAAAVAIITGAAYLLFSGQSVATQRAFVMAAVMFTAILVDRRAISIRTLALAACVILLVWPETLSTPGFQMSFAATLALIVSFGFLNDHQLLAKNRIVRWVMASVISALVAGTATMPFAAAHFNQIPHYGVLANVVAVPIMGLVVMPGVLLATILAPIGLEGLGLYLVDTGLNAILWVARQVASLPHATTMIKAPGPGALGLIGLGGALFVVMQGYWRGVGVLMVVFAAGQWWVADRPVVVMTQNAEQIGILHNGQRPVWKPNRQKFAASVWLRRDGAGDQNLIELRPSDVPDMLWNTPYFTLCAQQPSNDGLCLTPNAEALKRQGAVAGYIRQGQMQWVTSRGANGARLWNSPQARRQRLIGAD